MRERHRWSVFSDLRNRAARPNIREEPGRGPELIDLGVILYPVDAIQVVDIVERIGKYNGGDKYQQGYMDVAC